MSTVESSNLGIDAEIVHLCDHVRKTNEKKLKTGKEKQLE